MTPEDVRFLSHVQTGPGCWEWTGGKYASGYGVFRAASGPGLAHRSAYRLFVGPIPDGMLVCHTCDNPPCVNPDHLFLGSQLDNMRDAAAKGRVGGTRSGWSSDPGAMSRRTHRPRATEDQLRRIRDGLAAGSSCTSIAHEVNLSLSAVSRIKNGIRRTAA